MLSTVGQFKAHLKVIPQLELSTDLKLRTNLYTAASHGKYNQREILLITIYLSIYPLGCCELQIQKQIQHPVALRHWEVIRV